MAWCLVKHRDNFTFTFYNVFVGKPEGKRPLKDLGVDGR
jgi:hypothetical protein